MVETQKGRAIECCRQYIGLRREIGNLTVEEEKGREEVEKGVKEGNWMLYGTDKSERLVLDLKDNFLKVQIGHTGKDEVVTLKEVGVAEVRLYEHTGEEFWRQ